MLLKYKVGNFCSFKESTEFEMLASPTKVKNRFKDNYVNILDKLDVLKVAVIVGENAGGKSNFIKSLDFFKFLFQDHGVPHTLKRLINNNNYNPASKLCDENVQKFELEILGKNNRMYLYNLSIDYMGIQSEELQYKEINSKVWNRLFGATRRASTKELENKYKTDYEIHLNNKLQKGKIKEIFDQKNLLSSFVVKLAISGDEDAMEFVEWVNNKLFPETNPVGYGIYKDIQKEDDDIRILNDARYLEILRMVDSSISDIEIDDENPFRKSVIVREGEQGKRLARALQHESTGVRDFFAWAVQIFRVVYEDKVVFADELDGVLNPVLSDKIIAFINGSEHLGQFIFSTHNILHLDLKRYMKEQIYFVTKNKTTLNSELYSLADFPEIRYDTTKIYELYMQGLLGGTDFE